MTLRDLLKKKERLDAEHAQTAKQTTSNTTSNTSAPSNNLAPPTPEFTFVRTTTNTQEVIIPPSFPGDDSASLTPHSPTSPKSKENTPSKTRRLSALLHRPKSTISPAQGARDPSPTPSDHRLEEARKERPTLDKRRSSVLTLGRKRASTLQSEHVPANLPDAQPVAVTVTPDADGSKSATQQEKEAQATAEARWERRATLLAETTERSRSRSVSAASAGNGSERSAPPTPGLDGGTASPRFSAGQMRPGHQRKISDVTGDVNIQEAIRLHESGELEAATKMFGVLASPQGQNNALAQILYALSLRHGWGVPINKAIAFEYLSYAASNSAAVESPALNSGVNTGGAAKGELVLAIFELGNCFRHGWGCNVDKMAARQYYETAANLGDTDAMTEVAWCYLEGFGGGKDKWKAAQYLRLAEQRGKKEVGDTWIWKEKYNGDAKRK